MVWDHKVAGSRPVSETTFPIMVTLDQIKRVVQRCLEDLILDKEEVEKALRTESVVIADYFGLDALDLVEMVMAVEDEFNVRIGDTEMESHKDVGDIRINRIPEIIYAAQE